MLRDAITENIKISLGGVVDDVDEFLNWVYDQSGLILERMNARQITHAVCDYEDMLEAGMIIETSPENWGE